MGGIESVNDGGPNRPRAANPARADADLDFSVISEAVRRRAKWIVLPTLLAFVASVAFVQMYPPKYRSEARLIVESGENAFTRPDNDRGGPGDRVADEQGVVSQVQIIQSRDVARGVVDKLNLANDPEFGGAGGIVSRLLRSIGFGPSKAATEDRVLTAFYDRLLVYQVEKSRIIAVGFTARDPALAAKVANTVVDTYLQFQQDAKRLSTRNATAWLETEIQQLRKRVADAEARVETFRANAGLLVGTNNTTINAQQLSESNTELVSARAQEAELKARAKLLREILSQGRALESRDMAQSEMLRRLFDQRVATRGALAEQSTTLLDSHPRIRELRAQLADLDRQIRSETDKLVRQLETDARVAAARVEALGRSVDELRKRTATGNEQEVQLRALEREAKAQRDLLENYLARFRDASARVNDAALLPDARMVSRAAESNVPAFPKKIPTIFITTLGAFSLALGFVVTGALLGAVGQQGNRDRTEDEAFADVLPETVSPGLVADAAPPTEPVATPRAWTPAPPIVPARALEPTGATAPAIAPEIVAALDEREAATVPGIRTGESVDPDRQDADDGEPRANRAFEIGSLEWIGSLIAEEAGPTGCTLVVGHDRETRAEEAAVVLARWLATRDTAPRVLLIDLDPKGPVAALALNDRQAPGLLDAVSAKVSFGDIVHRDRASRLHVVPRGRADGIDPDSAADRLGMIIDALRRSYDHIIVAAAPMSEPLALEAITELAQRAMLIHPEHEPEAAEVLVLKEMGVPRVLPIHIAPGVLAEIPVAVA